MRPLNREEILSVFSKKERRKIKLPELELINWENLDFLGWIHSSGHLGFVVYEFRNKLRGIVLERNPHAIGSGVRMCSWCYTLNTASGVRLFTYQIPNTKITIGNYICADLQCSFYIRGIKETGIAQMQENLSVSKKIQRYRKNIENFFSIIDEKINTQKNSSNFRNSVCPN